jgi:hypothetical protein
LFGDEETTKAWFKERGVNIDRFTVELTSGEHSAIHGLGWDRELRNALERAESEGEALSARGIWDIGYRQMRRYRIANRPLIPYRD